MRVLINHADTTLGIALTLELRKFEAGRNLLYGTELGGIEGRKVRKSIRSVLAKDPPKLLLRTIPQCQVVVFALEDTPVADLERILTVIEAHDFDKPFCFILISGVQTWGLSEIPEPPEGEEKATSLNETMFETRKPLPGFEDWKAIEDRVLALRQNQPLVSSFVVCAGVLYGGSDGAFHDHFKAAWLGQTVEQAPILQVGGPKGGANNVPCVHVRDVAKLVKIIAQTPSEEMAAVTPYQVAVDGKPATQQQVLEGLVKHVSDLPEVPVNPAYTPPAFLTLDLEIQASPAMKSADDGGDFEWSFPDGILASMPRVAKEFTSMSNLKAIRCCVVGAPLAGKTLPAKMVAEHYRLPYLEPKAVLAEAKTAPGEFGQQFREMLNGLESDIAVAGEPRPDAGPRVPDTWLVQAVRWKLATNACKFRGYVLDGFPRTQAEAKALFMEDKPLEEGEEVPEGEEREQVVSAVAPEFVLEIVAEAKTLATRVDMLPDDERVAGHNDAAGLERRTLAHLERVATGGECAAFFQDAGVEVLSLDESECALGKDDLFETCRLYIEQQGRPNNYLDALDVVDECRRDHFEVLEEKALRTKAAAELARKGSKELDVAKERELELERLKRVAEHEALAAQAKSKPLRPFLMEAAIPKLTEGLVELCRVSPENPLDFLADFLEREALRA